MSMRDNSSFVPEKDLILSTEIEQKGHLRWGSSYVGGTIKAYFVPSVRFGREIVELIQRADIDHISTTFDYISSLNRCGIGDFIRERDEYGKYDLNYRNIESAVTGKEQFDCMVIPACAGWGMMSAKARMAILNRVKEGAGLVLVQPFDGEGYGDVSELDELSPLKALYKGGFLDTEKRNPELDKMKTGKWISKEHYINRGIPFDLIPFDEVGYFPYKATADAQVIIQSESGDPIVAVKEYGKGRVVVLAYYRRDILPQHAEYIGWDDVDDSLTANWHGGFDSTTYNYLEYFYSFFNRAMIWASGKTPTHSIASALVDNAGKLEVKIQSDDQSQALREIFAVRYEIFDMYDNKVSSDGVHYLSKEEITMPKFFEYGGRYRIHVYLEIREGSEYKVCDWTTIIVDNPQTADITNLRYSPENLNYNDKLSVTIDKAVDAESKYKTTVVVSLFDAFDRVIDICKEEIFTTTNQVNCELIADTKQAIYVKVQADLLVSGHLVKRITSGEIMVVPGTRQIQDFEMLICLQNRGHGDLLKLERDRLIEMGSTGLYLGDNKIQTRTEAEGFCISWYHRHDYRAMKEKYIITGDKKYLERHLCMNAQDFHDVNKANIDRVIPPIVKYGAIGYVVNDEGSLTCYSDESDICYCNSCIHKMRVWLHNEYESLDKLNESWDRHFAYWDEVVPDTFYEAKKRNIFTAWIDHRRFMNVTITNGYKMIKEMIQVYDPEANMNIAGTQPATPYTAYDYYSIHQHVSAFRTYMTGGQIEMHRSFMNPGTVLGVWFGYGQRYSFLSHKAWAVLFHNVKMANIFWEYCCINPDFTFSKSAMDLAEVFNEIRREGFGKLLLYAAKRDHLNIAVHYSLSSQYACYTEGHYQKYEDNRVGWYEILEDLGYQYNVIDTKQIETGELASKGFKVLILPYAIALSPEETANIREFVRGGGFLVGDIRTGLLDHHGKISDDGSLDVVFGIKHYMNIKWESLLSHEHEPVEGFSYFDNTKVNPDIFNGEFAIRTTTAEAAYVDTFSLLCPQVTVNEYGKGKAIFLNFPLNDYHTMKKDGLSTATYETIKNVMGLANIESFASVQDAKGNHPTGMESVYYEDGKAKYLGVQRELSSRVTKRSDGVMYGEEGSVLLPPEPITIILKKESHVYDIRKRKYLGFTDLINDEIEDSGSNLYAILPYQICGVNVVMPEKVELGTKLNIAVKLDSDKPVGAYNNVIAVNAYSPSGKYSVIFSENIIISGNELSHKVDIAYNEEPGDWIFTFKDVASGIEVAKTLTI